MPCHRSAGWVAKAPASNATRGAVSDVLPISSYVDGFITWATAISVLPHVIMHANAEVSPGQAPGPGWSSRARGRGEATLW